PRQAQGRRYTLRGDRIGHHWLPREVAGDECESWPTSRLCAWHHHEWHTAMTDYQWGGLPALERARARRRAA
ncbi:MAG TPA: hypothetical protein VK039_00235, partial [Brevibacterium sp.]|nr:hypothetical protein [Brevibacterium sp.]